jgi:hypothetical protein
VVRKSIDEMESNLWRDSARRHRTARPIVLNAASRPAGRAVVGREVQAVRQLAVM